MEGKHYLPKYLNALPQILWWELDELAFLAVGTAIGIMANAQIIGAGIGFLSMKLYSSQKKKRQPGYFKHFLYKLGLFGIKGKYPEYWIKEIMM